MAIDIHAIDVVQENPFLLLRCQPPFAAGRLKEFLAVLLRPILHIPVAVIGQQIPIRSDQKRSRPAGWIEDGEFRDLLGRLAFAQCTDGVLDDVLDDIGRRVIDTARFLDLRLLLHLRLMPGREPDDLPQKLFIDLAENFRGEHGKLVGTLGIVERLRISLSTLSSIFRRGVRSSGDSARSFSFWK